MIRTLIAKAARDALVLFLALFALMLLFPWLNLWISSMISVPAFSEFLTKALPKQWERMSGVPFSELATPAGRAALIYVHPLILLGSSIWAIARGSDCVSGEIGRGTMEMLLAQPVRRSTVFLTHALVTTAGSALLVAATWLGVTIALGTVPLYEKVSAALFLPPASNLFCRMVCIGGVAALVSSWGSQRWRTVGIIVAWYVLSNVLEIVGHAVAGWEWVRYGSFMCAYEPQTMVAHPEAAWSLWTSKDGAIAGLGSGGMQLVLVGLGVLCYIIGAVIFHRREIPAPL
jgi:ABC-2 type transport system permease protein